MLDTFAQKCFTNSLGCNEACLSLSLEDWLPFQSPDNMSLFLSHFISLLSMFGVLAEDERKENLLIICMHIYTQILA